MNTETNPHAHLRAAFNAGCLIQAWHLNGITREEAIALAVDAAFTHGRHHSYVAEPFQPHEWVIEAILAAANGITSNDGRWDTLSPPEDRGPEFGCDPHLYQVHPEDEAKALAVWDFRMPTGHLPPNYRFYVERLVSNTDPAFLVRENELLRDEVKRLAARIAELEADANG